MPVERGTFPLPAVLEPGAEHAEAEQKAEMTVRSGTLLTHLFQTEEGILTQ